MKKQIICPGRQRSGRVAQAVRSKADKTRIARLGRRALLKTIGVQGLIDAGQAGGEALVQLVGFDGMSLRARWARHLQWHLHRRKRSSRHIPKPCIFCISKKTFRELNSGSKP